MSQSGAIVYYVTEELANPDELLKRLVGWPGANWLLFAHRTLEESRAWNLVKKFELDEVDSPFPKNIKVCSRCSPESLWGEYRPGTELKIDFSQSPKTDVFCQAQVVSRQVV